MFLCSIIQKLKKLNIISYHRILLICFTPPPDCECRYLLFWPVLFDYNYGGLEWHSYGVCEELLFYFLLISTTKASNYSLSTFIVFCVYSRTFYVFSNCTWSNFFNFLFYYFSSLYFFIFFIKLSWLSGIMSSKFDTGGS